MLLEPRTLRTAAADSLAHAEKPGRIILIHTAVTLLLSLVLSVADHLLNRLISTTGGLGGMGMRSTLTTVQSMLRLAQVVLLPFWQIGYTCYILKVSQGQPAGTSDLYEGFRRFGPILRLKALMAILTIPLAIVSAYAGSFLFLVTPWAAPMLQEMSTLLTNAADEETIINTLIPLVLDQVVPISILFGLCFLVGAFFLFFRFRFAELWLMDHPQGGALAALVNSHKLMKGNWKAMLRVDLGFWWFYLLELLVTALGFGDIALGMLGIEMTTDAFGSYLIFFGLYLCGQLALYWWKRNYVAATYAHAYLILCPQEQPTINV